MASQTSNHEELRDSFAIHNLERLASYPPPAPQEGDPVIPTCKISLKILEKWSDDNIDSINAAISAQAFGGKNDISWQNAFLPFMESAAVYLRDWGALRDAWETYRVYKYSGGNDDVRNTAIARYHDAYSDLRELAQKWNMDYMTLCDFVSSSPDGEPDWDGPFCGAFYTTAAQKDKPFIGVSFKGTNPLQPKEVHVDYNYQLMDGGSPLPDTRVSTGVWTGLFGEFENPSSPLAKQMPFEVIMDKLSTLVPTLETSTGLVRIHVTGHSLGGSYSTLCYPVMARGFQNSSFSGKAAMGDEYTFGAPRVGNQNFAILIKTVVDGLEGQSWRIVNNQDIVPQVPPTTLKPDEKDFCHVDKGEQIFKDKVPEPIPSEIGQPPPQPYDIKTWQDFINAVRQSTDHLPNFYKDSLVYAIAHPKA